MSIVQFSKALADGTRARLMAVLARHELNVRELTEALRLPQSSVSHHLRILAEAGLAEARRDGLWAFYRATASGPAAEYLRCLAPFLDAPDFATDLGAAARVLAARREAARRFFDAHAPDWPAMLRSVLGDTDLARAVRERLPACTDGAGQPRPCATAADLGCGAGQLLPVLHERAENVIGVDHSRAMLARARETLGDAPWASLRVGELEHLPLRDAEADLALVCMALHHLPEPPLGVAEAARVLAPGGHLLIADFDKHGDETLRERHGDHWLGFSRAELAAFCEASGLFIAAEDTLALPGGLTLRFMTARKP
ncbi:transcriptional regulator, ArsR family [Alkalidesulfovibrio alkalitolerans DSM 16529]|jgi:ArsR family transcriptional regulator|uniref:Transcriptional regulator, ArsR family n=1 Tax=Alkalidesulfovibrio alkalitolerans DSM 16529 TaxID=1121439 RepID=S7THL6_9BACT|nr:metalloregulator ArsR/SmtB family transcription factor [Alkalidesulfovibrio alkalitolerans]EPR36120.1 transcriptional regulator, ArsR family [Alkalidesulfovibrio alkalitolerans DSM 16529]